MPDVTERESFDGTLPERKRIELAFEDHRFYDVRRWVIGPDAYHRRT
jgi:hypothetical protein